ncbi:putative nucleotidyltransferase substrate binding domain-containing protein [Kribbella sp. NPDC050124]|uniref:putative nucleotidyltransferase substrate binding domain-containing protein n=1 Tax=Kribbella sp. NPDC050124 TaxID=3364114 RepID=UPI00378E23D8
MQEYIDFLGKQAPYDRLDAADLQRLGRCVEVEFFAAGTVIVQAYQPQLDHLYVVRTGSVQVVDRSRVVDELGAGDTFGHISVLSGLPPPLSVVAVSETLCYRFPDPRSILEHPERLTFAHYNTMVSRDRLTSVANDAGHRPVRDLMRPPAWCRPDTPIREAARAITESGQSCVIFPVQDGFGIMTDSDCRRLVATGEVSVDAPVSAIATSPARVVDVGTTVSAAFLEMLMHGVHHLVVVEPDGRAVGIARVFDLSSVEVRDPLRIRSAIDQAAGIDDLAAAGALLRPTAIELFEAGLPADRTSALLGVIIEAIVERCVALEPTFGGDDPEYDTSWLVLGSLGRREPLPCSDVDTALVWQQLADGPLRDPRRLVDAAESVITNVEKCGLARCPDGANASNPLFNRSRAAWFASAQHWIARPDGPGALLLSAMVTDSRPITGLQTGRALLGSIGALTTNKSFLKRMLDQALAVRPPTGFVRDFVVEAGGKHQGELNLKRGGLAPVVGLGRWIAVTTRMPVSSTQDRLAYGAQAGLLTQDESDTLRGAHREMFELLFRHEIEAIRSGRAASTYLNPKGLDSLTRRYLREAFRAISRVQSRLESEWLSRIG